MKTILAIIGALLIIGLALIGLVDVAVQQETNEVIDIINNEDAGFAESWARVIRKSSDFFGEDSTAQLLSKDNAKFDFINSVVVRDELGNRKIIMFFDNGEGYDSETSVIIDTWKYKNKYAIDITDTFCDAYNDIFSAFKARLEREFE